MRGRQPDHSGRERRGTGHRPLPAKREEAPAAPDVRALPAPEPPDYLDAPRRAIWKEIVEDLHATGYLHPLDRYALEGLVTQIQTLRSASG